MNDCDIVDLYFERDELAIAKTRQKYGAYLRFISKNVLRDDGDTEECVNDTYMRAWESIPPERPKCLRAFLGKIARNLSVNRYLSKRRQKRGGGECDLVLDELLEVVPDGEADGTLDDRITVRDCLSAFLASLPERNRIVFVRRYFYVMSVLEISRIMNISESNVKVILMRTRASLKKHLIDKGVVI